MMPLWRIVIRRDLRSIRTARIVGVPLALFLISIVVATASIAFLRSLQDSFDQAIFQQRQVLLGADLVLSSNQPLDLEALTALPSDQLSDSGGNVDRVVGFTTMARNTASGNARLAQIRAITPRFPLYGRIDTEPVDALNKFRTSRGVLIEPNLLHQLGVDIGSSITVGSASFPVLGTLQSIPGEIGGFSLFAPRIYLPVQFLEETGLTAFGSQIRYRYLLRMRPEVLAERIAEIRKRANTLGVRAETVTDREESVGAAIERAYLFLNLAGVVTLLLGGISLAHGANALLRRKERQVAIFRCLGAPTRQAAYAVLWEIVIMSLIAASVGALLGSLLQFAIQDAPIPEPWNRLVRAGGEMGFSVKGFLEGFLLGAGCTILFAIPALVRLSKQSISEIFRSENHAPHSSVELASYALLIGVTFLASWYVSNDLVLATKFFVASCLAIGILGVAIQALQSIGRKFVRSALPYPIRYALASLYRPQTTTRATLLVFALIGFLVSTIAFGRVALEAELRHSKPGAEQNLLLFDVQPDQKQPLKALLETRGHVTVEQVPIVTMRLSALRGTAAYAREKLDPEIPEWTLRREYRSTYRNSVEPTERLVAGIWPARPPADGRIPVSIENGLAEKLKVWVGDELTFDVQGVEFQTRIAAVRTVNWRQLGTNFFFVFPEGVLEAAPQMYATLTSIPDPKQKANLLRELATEFPNVSSVDLDFLISILDSVFREIGKITSLLVGAISILALLLFANAIIVTNEQRAKEMSLLRVLGAAPGLVSRIVVTEYLMVGLFSVAAATLLSTATSYIIVTFVLEYPFRVPTTMLSTIALIYILGAPSFAAIVSRYTYQQFEILKND